MVLPSLTEDPLRTTVASVSGVPVGLSTAGRWHSSSSDSTFAVHDPASGEVIAEVADATVSDGIAALDSAVAAQSGWAATTGRERAEILRKAFDGISARTEDIASVLTAEMGKPLQESRGEVAYGAEFFRWFSEQAAHVAGSYGSAPTGGCRIVTTEQPVGPCLLITPWNFPLAMGTRKIGAALAAGCSVIIKPAALTPLTMTMLVDILHDCGVPPGVVNIVTTSRSSELSAALMSDSRLRKVSFTGSTAVGSTLLRQAAEHVLTASMELGGNGPFVVCSDADIDAAVAGAMMAKFRNGGQSCVAANRFIVHADVHDEFVTKLRQRVSALVLGPGTAPRVDIGPVVSGKQARALQELVDGAVDEGGRLLVGGSRVEGAGSFFEPTLLIDVPLSARIAREEIFGPVAVVYRVDSDEDALSAANDTEFGLVGYVFSKTRALAYAERLETGMVGVNRGLVSDPAGAFGGIKASGLGREGGTSGIHEYLETKYMAVEV